MLSSVVNEYEPRYKDCSLFFMLHIFVAAQYIFLFKINENYFSLLRLENGFAFRPNLENLARLKNSIMGC